MPEIVTPPSARRTRIVVITVSLLILGSYAALFTWRASVWHRLGWAGVSFYPPVKKGEPAPLPIFGVKPGTAQMVWGDSPGAEAGIRAGDEILRVSGIPTTETDRLRRLAEKINTGGQIVYTLRRGGKEVEVPVILSSRWESWPFLASMASSIVAGLIFLAIGIIVLWLKPADRRAFVFFCVAVLGAVSYFASTIMALEGQSSARGVIPSQVMSLTMGLALIFFLITAVIFGTLLLHLALIFPKERPVLREYPHLLRFIYIAPFFAYSWGPIALLPLSVPRASIWARLVLVALVLLAIGLGLKLMKFARERRSWKETIAHNPLLFAISVAVLITLLAQTVRQIAPLLPAPREIRVAAVLMMLVIFAAGCLAVSICNPVATCIALYRSYRESDVEAKRQLRWPLWGTLIGVGGMAVITVGNFIVVAVNPAVMTGTFYGIAVDMLSKFAYLVIPASFAFSILKYRLMDIDLVIKKTVVYASLTGIILVLYLILVAGIGRLLVRSTGVENQELTIIFTLAVALVFIPVRSRLQGFVDRRMFRRRHDYPEALRELSREVSVATSRESMMKLTAEVVQQALQNRSVVIFDGDPQRGYTAAAKVGVPDEVLGRVAFDRGESLPSQLGAVRVPGELDLPDAERAKLRRIGSALLVPILLKGKLVGFLSAGGKLSDEQFDPEDRSFLQSVADQLAIGSDMFRMRREEQDYEQASEIQRALLPKQIPQIAGFDISGVYQPARVVGGDYYDVLRLSDRRLGLCIGDVAGKGMPAALLMSSLQATVKAVASDSAQPSEICEKVRSVLCSNITSGRFLTFFYCVLDAERRTLVYTNAGHNPPILLRAAGGSERLEEGGPAVARLFQNPYRQAEVSLQPGDRLVLFTDGVTEARDRDEEEFGEHRLITLLERNKGLTAAELQRAVLESVSQFSHGTFGDDVTMVVVSVSQ